MNVKLIFKKDSVSYIPKVLDTNVTINIYISLKGNKVDELNRKICI